MVIYLLGRLSSKDKVRFRLLYSYRIFACCTSECKRRARGGVRGANRHRRRQECEKKRDGEERVLSLVQCVIRIYKNNRTCVLAFVSPSTRKHRYRTPEGNMIASKIPSQHRYYVGHIQQHSCRIFTYEAQESERGSGREVLLERIRSSPRGARKRWKNRRSERIPHALVDATQRKQRRT